MSDQLTTTAEVKARIFTAGTVDTDDDALISSLIDQVTAWIQTYVGRRLVPEAGATYTFDTQDGYVLRIPKGIRAVTTLGVATTHQPDSGGSYTTVPASDFLLRPLAADRVEGWPATEIRFSRGTLSGTIPRFYRADNGARIVGDFGPAAVPLDIAAVCLDAVVSAYMNRKDGASGVIGADDTALPPWARFFSRGSPQRATLDRWRFVGMA